MRRRSATRWWFPALVCATGTVGAQEAPQLEMPKPEASQPAAPSPPESASPDASPPEHHIGPDEDHPWLDKTQQGVQQLATRSAARLDRLFGPEEDEAPYRAATGSVAPALLWDQFRGWQPKVRFHVDLPLPKMNERFNAFIGRVNRDEYVSESQQQSGAFQRQYGPASDEQTLAGVSYHTPLKQGGRFDAGTGVRLQFPLDPYLKGSYLYELGRSTTGLLSLRQTVFWQNSEHAGFTTRADLERLFFDDWLVRWTTSGTISQRSQGVFGYSAIRALRGFPNRRAVAIEVGFDGETGADIPLHEYGIKAAYRQSVMRDWLVLEVRSSLTYPREKLEQTRKASWGLGVGFEMFFGTDEFLARPVTF